MNPLPRLHRSLALLLALAAAGAASAADDAPAAQEQLVVTASRIPEDGTKLPLAWSSLSASDLALIGHTHINEAMQQVPGAWVVRGNGQESLIALRSPVLTGAGSCGAFLIAGDGINLRAPGFCNVNQLFDANTEQAGRIEVIKGPATALYGSNAMHGLINVISAAPSETLQHDLSVEGGSYDYYRAKYVLSGTRGPHGLSLRANGTSFGGYQDDSGYDQQKLTLRYDYAGATWDLSNVFDAANLNQETAGYIQGYKAYEDDDARRSNPNPEAYRDAWSARFHSRASRALDGRSTLTITPYLRDNSMKFLQHFVPWEPVEKNSERSVGLRAQVNTDADPLGWVYGADLEYTDGKLEEYQQQPFSPNQPQGIHYDYEVGASTAAVYSQLKWDPDTRWELTGGVRFEYTYYDYDNRATDGSACAPTAMACRFYRPSDRDDDFANWSFNAGASYSFSPQYTAYLRAASGFRAPQVGELYRLQSGQQVADLDSEELDSVEVGLRSTLPMDLEYDLSLYYMEKKNVIFQDENRYNVSGAKTRHYGAELSLDYRFLQDGYFRLDATVARHQYDNNVQMVDNDGNIKGNDIDTSPNAFGAARLGWNVLPGQRHESQAELEWVYMDSYFLEPDNRYKYDGHSLLNLRATTRLSSRWRATVRITNLLDEDYAERADYGFGEYRYFVGQPRSYYLEIGYRLGAL